MQAIQEVFVAEEWVKDARNEARVEANLCAKANRALGATKQDNEELTTKLTTEEKVRKSAKTNLKNAQDEAEDQHKKLYHTEIKLAIEKQRVLELKEELQRAKEATRTAQKAAEALK